MKRLHIVKDERYSYNVSVLLTRALKEGASEDKVH